MTGVKGEGMKKSIRIVFDGPPDHNAGRFVEVEDENGKSIDVGEWVNSDGYWYLVFPDHRLLRAENKRLRHELETQKEEYELETRAVTQHYNRRRL